MQHQHVVDDAFQDLSSELGPTGFEYQRFRRFMTEEVLAAIEGAPATFNVERAPFDAIFVGAAAPAVPESLRNQLADGGRLLIPIGDEAGQRLLLIERCGAEWQEQTVERARFVPLVGEEGW